MELKLLIKNTSYLMTTKFIQFFVGIFRSKINAIFLGTEGVGIVSQFSVLMSSSSSFTNLGMSEAVVKQIAQNSSETNSKVLIASSVKTYLITVSAFIIISTSLLFFFKDEVTIYIFGSYEFINFFYLALLSFPLLIINGVFFAILKGFKGIKHIARARIAIIFSNFFLFLPLVLIYKLNGAIIYLPISYLITLMWNYYYTNKYYLKINGISFKFIWQTPVSKKFQKEMLTFSGFGIFISVVSIASEFIGRSVVVTNLGIDKIGIYSPIIMFASLFSGFLLPSFNTYLFPRFSQVKSNIEAAGIINDALRLATISLLPLLLLGIPYRDILIRTFYTNEFLEASNYLPFHFIGVVFNVWFVVFGQTMTPRGYIKQHSIFKFSYHVINITLVFWLVPLYGLYGYMMKFILGYIFLFALYYMFLTYKTDFKIYLSNMLFMAYLLVTTTVLILLDVVFGYKMLVLVLGPIMLISSYFLLKKTEKNFLKSKIQSLKSRIR